MQNLSNLAMHRNNISGAHGICLRIVQDVHVWCARMVTQCKFYT